MTSLPSDQSSNSFNLPSRPHPSRFSVDDGLQRVINHLSRTLQRDELVQQTVCDLQSSFQVDRVVLYYFYRQWRGQVTFEALSDEQYSIFGSAGPDECFNDEYAELYLAGRIRAIANIETEPIHPCHRDYLQSLQVKANLAVPVLTNKGLWGLLIAHHCQAPRPWSEADIEQVKQAATLLANSPAIQDS